MNVRSRTLAATIAAVLAATVSACAEEAPARDPAPKLAAAADDLPTVHLAPAFRKLEFKRPVWIGHAGDGSDRLFVLEQLGRIMVFPNRDGVTEAKTFLDISDRVYMRHNEEGLLAIAFHPKYTENGHFYVYYSADDPRRGVLSRFRVSSEDPDRADPASEQVILEVEQPWGNHNGSTLLFGPDGYLYCSLGDGGAANDPLNHGQNLATLLGTILRLDVDRAEGDRPYAIPADNPFVERANARPEIWAYGLRNVWRMSFDRETGQLWAGDVGQNRWEEIDVIIKGGNYGWNVREGSHPFMGMADPEVELIDPVVEHDRREAMSITGGYVYRGKKLPNLVGAYVYADYVTGRMWALRYADGGATAHREILTARTRPHVTSFGEDEAGELYLCVFDNLDGRGGGKGRIMRLVEN